MTDHFELLEEPRRPWLDLEALKARFLQLAEASHPDRIRDASESGKAAGSQRFMALNAAHHCLRQPKDRLLHLIELERGSKPAGIESVPAELMELFVQVGQVCRDVDRFLSDRVKVSSPLRKVQMFGQAMEWTDQLNRLQETLNVRRGELEKRLKAMNAAWASAPAVGSSERPAALPLDELEMIYRTLSYFARWTGQLQEHIVQLSL